MTPYNLNWVSQVQEPLLPLWMYSAHSIEQAIVNPARISSHGSGFNDSAFPVEPYIFHSRLLPVTIATATRAIFGLWESVAESTQVPSSITHILLCRQAESRLAYFSLVSPCLLPYFFFLHREWFWHFYFHCIVQWPFHQTWCHARTSRRN